MLWVLIGSASMRRFQRAPQQMFSRRNMKVTAILGGKQMCYLKICSPYSLPASVIC